MKDFELQEIALLPDGVFQFSDAESAVLIARRLKRAAKLPAPVRYRQIREADADLFKRSYHATVERRIPQSRFAEAYQAYLRVPELEEVWEWLAAQPSLSVMAHVGKGLEYKDAGSLPTGTLTVSTHRFPGATQGFVWFGDEREALLIHELPRPLWLNLDDSVIRRPGTGCAVGLAQVLLNYARVSRGPWRLKALLDPEGHPVTSRFLTVRPRDSGTPIEYLWALCNNPVANAYIATRTTKRDILAGAFRGLPIPRASAEDVDAVAAAVRAYFAEVSAKGEALHAEINEARAHDLLLRVDALVLRLYNLPPRMERQLLDYFAGQQRPGVPFSFDRYYPPDFTPCFSLHEYLSPEFRRSTAGELRKRTASTRIPPTLLAALDAADEAYRVEEPRWIWTATCSTLTS